MPIDKKTFLKTVTVVCDTAEQENKHILKKFDEFGVKYIHKHLDFGDYSFTTSEKVKDGTKERDFTLNCVIERKANVDELYNNVVQDRERIESEFNEANKLSNDFILLIENCATMDELKGYTLKDWQLRISPQRQVCEIGKMVYSTIMSWRCGNRYRFTVEFAKDKDCTAGKMLELFYYYWANYKKLSGNRKIKK